MNMPSSGLLARGTGAFGNLEENTEQWDIRDEDTFKGWPSRVRQQSTCLEIHRVQWIRQILKSLCCFQYSCKSQESSLRTPFRDSPQCSISSTHGGKLLRLPWPGLESTEHGIPCSLLLSSALKRWCSSLMLGVSRCKACSSINPGCGTSVTPPGLPTALYHHSLYLCNSATGISPENHLCVTFIMKTNERSETKYTYRRYYFPLGKSVS